MRAWKVCAILALTLARSSFAFDPQVYAVDVRVQVDSSPARINFTWPYVDYARQYTIRRKTINDSSWTETLALLPGDVTSFSDSNVTAGSAFEYEFEMATSLYPYPQGDSSQWINAYTYVYAGVNAPAEDYKGKIVLVVDSSVSAGISSELSTFQQDLIGAGWTVIRREAARDGSVNDVRNIIRAEYNADPSNVRSVVLIGHVPVPYSGAINPDLHPSHLGAWPADVFYGDMDGSWTDNSVSITSADSADNNNYPGDGKFDQSLIPSDVELEVGRIDFWSMPSFQPRSETDLLRNYFRKDHAFRNRLFTAPRRGLIHDNFGDLDGDAPAVDAWRHFGVFFGPGNAQAIGADQFFPTLNSNGYLWAYGCGGGGYTKADGVGSTTDFAAGDPQAVFLILHGSYFGDWNNSDNFLRAAIGSPNYTLASIWSGLPHWYMHHMALGKSVGFSTRVSQNNVNLYKSHENLSAHQVHISLIGDPTLEMFPVIPAANLSGQAVGGGVNLNWSGSGDGNITGYNVYYASSPGGPYQKIGTTSGLNYTHSVGAGTHYYMVRAVKLETSGSGTFYNASQGIFTSVTKSTGGGTLPVVSVTAEDADASEVGPDTGTFKFSRDVVDASSLTIDFTVSGSAINGTDYAPIEQSVVIPAWVGAAWVTIRPYADGEIEGDENVVVTLNDSSTYTVGSAAATVVIHDSVAANQRPSISAIADQNISAGGSTLDLSFTVSDAETSPADLQVRASSSDETIIPNQSIVLGGTGADRTIRVSALPNKSGTAKITVVVSDGSLEASQVFNVNVSAVNNPPVASSQSLTVAQDGQLVITLSGSDPEGSALTYSILTTPVKGSFSGTAPNLVYVPFKNLTGTDSFTFAVSDGALQSAPATVNIMILAVNHSPTAISLTTNIVEDTPVNLILKGADPDGDALAFSIVGSPSKGTLTDAPPTVLYTPARNQSGTDIFTFKVNDGLADSQLATVTINISAVNDPPAISTIADQVIRKNRATGPIPFTVTDPDDSIGSVRVTPASDNTAIVPANSIVIGGTGSARTCTITPVAGITGTVQITLLASDGKSNSRSQFKLTITNSVPMARDDSVTVNGSSIDIATASLLQNDSDPDGDLLVLSQTSGGSASGGTVTLSAGTVHYASASGFAGEDSFTYTIQDSSGATATAAVHLQVAGSPRISSIGRQTDGSVLLSFHGPPGKSCEVLVSEDTQTWTVAGFSSSGSSGEGQFRDSSAVTNRLRIYRVEWP